MAHLSILYLTFYTEEIAPVIKEYSKYKFKASMAWRQFFKSYRLVRQYNCNQLPWQLSCYGSNGSSNGTVTLIISFWASLNIWTPIKMAARMMRAARMMLIEMIMYFILLLFGAVETPTFKQNITTPTIIYPPTHPYIHPSVSPFIHRFIYYLRYHSITYHICALLNIVSQFAIFLPEAI